MMRKHGKLDVIRVEPGNIYISGKKKGGTLAKDALESPGTPDISYLLINGGVFSMHGPNKYASVGPTSTTDLQVPIPKIYKKYYERIQGHSNSFLWSGPSLLKPWYGTGAKWKYRNSHAGEPGYLSHANQPNERLVLVQMSNDDKYVFAYTAKTRGNGLGMRQLRGLIMSWFQIMRLNNDAKITQITNLDGGGSLQVFWKEKGKKVKRIAQGNIADERPRSHNDPGLRRVTNFITISPDSYSN